jgi:hypothetical protein
MDSDAYYPGSLVVAALARDGPPPVDDRPASVGSALILGGPPRPGPSPKTSTDAREAHTQERLSALVGALSLRAVRARSLD